MNKTEALAKQKMRYLKIKDTPEQRFAEYRRSAKARGIAFTITMEQFMLFWKKDCFYCGDPVRTVGLDRIDSSVGYVIGNIAPGCWACNRAKGSEDRESFIVRCCRVAAIHGGCRNVK